jgi:chromosome segregation ATPase
MACKMIKKGLLGAALGAGALALLFGTAATSYVKTAFHHVRNSAKASVPIEFEIERARQLVADLEPAIREQVENLARAEEDVKELKNEIVAFRANMDKERTIITALKKGLESGDHLAGNPSYTREEVTADLARRFDHYQQLKQIIKDKESALKSKEKTVAAAHEMLNSIKTQKEELLAKIDEIEARHKSIEAASSHNEFTFDDSALDRAKQIISELDKRLNVEARKAELLDQYNGKQLPVSVEPTRDVVKEIDAEFGTGTASDKSL